MIVADLYKGKRVAVLGLGITGRALINSFILGGAEVIAWDDRAEAIDKCRKIKSKVDLIPVEKWDKIDLLVMSPGIPFKGDNAHKAAIYARSLNIPIKNDIDILIEHKKKCRFIGITGTNGKTTTTSMIYEVLLNAGYEVDIGGNIGIPVMELKSLSDEGIYVLELSSYQLDLSAKLSLDIGILLNIYNDHIDRHGTLEEYTKVKCNIFSEKAFNIIGIDSMQTGKLLNTMNYSKMISVSGKIEPKNGIGWDDNKMMGIAINTKLQGIHNKENIAACYAACQCIGVKEDDIINGIQLFQGVKHRQEYIGEKEGVVFINDSKATNVISTERALSVYNDIYLILGGIRKQGDDFSSLFKYIDKIKGIYLIGEESEYLYELFIPHIKECYICNDMITAVPKAFNMALSNKKGVILLSPSCASFDQYSNFEERGDHFRIIVENLIN